MAKTSYIQIPSGLDQKYFKALQSGDRFIFPHVKVKRLFTSRKRKKGLTQRSLIVQLAPVWKSFTSGTRTAWENAGAESSMSGFKQFVQDTSVRIANNISGYATPSTLYQSKVGRIKIESPAVGLKIQQLHPQSYYINKKVVGTRNQYEPFLITENISMPIDIGISYKSDLVSAGTGAYARFYVIVYSSYQGRDIENTCIINFDLSHAWERKTASISTVLGKFRGYTAFIEVYNARGDLRFDNIDIVHSGHNWARDPFCNSIETSFTKAFYQIPKNWASDSVPNGAQYGSIYHEI